MVTATELTVQWQMNRTRGARVLKRFIAAEHCDCSVSPVAFYHLFPSVGALLALKLSRKLSAHEVALCSSCAHHVPHFTAQALRAEAAAYARRPRRTLRLHECQRASRKLSAHAVALCSPCANHVPNYTAQAQRACGKRAIVLPHAFGLPAIVAGWTWFATSTTSAAAASTTTTRMRGPAHRLLRQALRHNNDAQPDRINTSGDMRPRRTLRAVAAAYAMLA